MTTTQFQKGKFYTLPIQDIRHEGNNSFFIVRANDKEYAIRMFAFQKNDPETLQRTELPCMVKDIHGDNIIFVQNFAQMFSDRYIAGNQYSFIVNQEAFSPAREYRYYDIRDEDGVPFKLRCKRETILVPNQKIKCLVSRPNLNKMTLCLVENRMASAAKNISPTELFEQVGISAPLARFIMNSFNTNPGFQEARAFYTEANPLWVIKAVMAITDVDKWPHLNNDSKEQLLDCYKRICLYLLEDSDYLLQFGESECENYQEWIADRVSMVETYQQSLSYIKEGRCSEEIDNILAKIERSGYIYHPHRRMRLLISLFSMQPHLLEEKIDSILDLVAEGAKYWKQPSFNNAFSGFLHYYIASNRERVNRIAVVYDEQSRQLLKRMVRSIAYYLLMTQDEGNDTQLYHSILLQCLSFVQTKNILSQQNVTNAMSAHLVERAFNTLLMSDEKRLELNWSKDYSNLELLAYQMSLPQPANTTFLTRSYEAQNVRFTVSTEGIALSRSISTYKEKNVLPIGFPDWHNLQIFLDTPNKLSISKQEKNIRTWKNFWNNVELGLFEDRRVIVKKKPRKIAPEVGTETYVRVLWKSEDYPNRYYCRIEDPLYEGEGWIDTYQRGGSLGMFHYDPMLDIDSFYVDGKPIIFKVRVNSVGSPYDEMRTYTFDCLSYIDEMIREQVNYGEESDCKLFFSDEKANVWGGITSYGYGIFIPRTEENAHYQIGDSVRVRVTDPRRPNSIQGEIIGTADEEVDVKAAAEGILKDYYKDTYEETDEELEEEALTVSEDLFEPEYMKEIINIIDHKAVLETDNIKAYAYLSIAHILAKMIGDTPTMTYLEHRLHFLCILEDYGTNGRVNDEELENLGSKNSDMVEKFPLLKQRLVEMRIVNCFGQPEKNEFLWNVCHQYDNDHILSKLSRLMLSYNMAEGFGLQEHQKTIITKIKSLLNVNIELPKIYSFGEENQLTEFKTSIVYPPNNNMREDIKQQSFNIMKVICGMVNSYGGTLYLGVNDTGTAKGLEDDLEYFEGNKDKFDLYVRNYIRMSLGDQVNASIAIEHPDAGKHYIYAIKITPSKSPVILKLDNKFYLREGTSTYPIEMQELADIMAERNFEQYETRATDMESIDVSNEGKLILPEEKKETGLKIQHKSFPEDHIATSTKRKNVINNWEDGYYEATCFIRIFDQREWCVLDEVEWEDGLLTLAIHEDEEDGYLVIVYEDGLVNKVPISRLLEKPRGKRYKMCSQKKPIFMSPAKKDAALLIAFDDDHGKQFFRLDDLANMADGIMQSTGQTVSDVEFHQVLLCEIVDQEYIGSLQRMHNMKRTFLGFQALTEYASQEQEAMRKIGIEI